MGELAILNREGDTKVIWDPDNEHEVKAAKDQFKALVKEGFTAFSVDKKGEKGKKIEEFDKEAGKIILVPRIAGG